MAPQNEPPPLQTPQQPALAQAIKPGQEHPPHYNPLLHNVALGLTPLAVASLLLPPRKFNVNFVVLTMAALWGMNQLRYDYTGKSATERWQGLAHSMGEAGGMPERAQQMQTRIREEKAARLRREQQMAGLSEAERARVMREMKKDERGTLEAIWMGDAEEDWKAKREQKEKEAFKEGGGGVWGLIADQISEVWAGAKKNEGEKKNSVDGEPKKPS